LLRFQINLGVKEKEIKINKGPRIVDLA